MTPQLTTSLQQQPARWAGFMFLFVIVTYMSGFFIVGNIFVGGDFAASAANILAKETLFRFAKTLELIASVATVVLALALYYLLRTVNESLAMLALLWRIGEAIIGGLNVSLDYFAVALLSNTDFLVMFSAEQLQAISRIFFKASGPGFYVSVLFFSPASIIFWYLLYKSNYIPKLLAGWGVFASVVTCIVAAASLLLPQHAGVLQLGWAPIFIAEIVGGTWLMLKGARGWSAPSQPVVTAA